ncbi:hypothetical protein PCA31118_02523 [Pandoraea captiosa]|uniref:DUF2894 domain-containing protein n=1 Tax=Pandoraea captiosa TaxID=2508302 RepID=A0A5E5A1R0_9BURK|nr:DUF2894 domain-containing protein [Pandoraea captiosa]VVE67236.1 hypothetical protein PCA31118_02523 [Pandoraea captiosa]
MRDESDAMRDRTDDTPPEATPEVPPEAPADTAGPRDNAHAIAAQLDAWRAQGLHKRDPVRFHRIEALSRRAGAFSGDVRRVLDERLAALTREFCGALGADADVAPVTSDAADRPSAASRQTTTATSAATSAATSPTTATLAALARDMTQRVGASERAATSDSPRALTPSRTSTPSSPSAGPAMAHGDDTLPKRPVTQRAPSVPPTLAITPTVIATDDAFEDLDVLEYFRETWSKLSTDGNLRQSLAQVPENAGPLNSSHLVHRALSLMHDVSPDYLRHFLRHADALSWLEDMETTGVFGVKAAARAPAPTRSAKPAKSATPSRPSRAKAR